MNLLRCLALFATSLVSAMPAVAQQVDVLTLPRGGAVQAGTQADLDLLEKQFSTGDVEEARKTAKGFLGRAAKALEPQTDQSPAPAFDFEKSLIALAWVGADVDGSAVLRRIMVSEPSSSPFSLDLPGDGRRLYEVLISAGEHARLSSRYSFTRQENPVIAQIPMVAERILTPFFGLFGDVSEDLAARAKARTSQKVYATASEVMVPFRRATIAIKAIGRIPAEIESWSEDLAKASIVIRFTVAARSKWAVALVEDAKTRVLAVAATPDCTTTELAKPNQCLDKMAIALDAAFEACKTGCISNAAPAKEDIEAMEAVDDKLREHILKSKAAPLVRELQIRNRPATHFAFGIGTAHIARATLNRDRAKVNDDGDLVADPLSRQSTMVLLNWSPRGYDDDAPSPQPSERVRLFAAGVITPDPGIGVGTSFLVVRGLGIIAGYSVMFGRGRGDADRFDQAPANAADPLAVTRSRAWFVGVSYNFK